MSAAKEAAEKIAAAKDRILDVAYRDGLRLRTNQMSPFQFREHLGYEVDNLIVEARAAYAPQMETIRLAAEEIDSCTREDRHNCRGCHLAAKQILAAINGLMEKIEK